MSLDDLFRHTLVIKRQVATFAGGDPILDDYGQPVTAETTVATVEGLIQPISAREVALASQAGAVVGTHKAILYALTGLGTHCWIESGGVRYDVLSMLDDAGQGHHLKLALQAVT
jgi:hypothetical protein